MGHEKLDISLTNEKLEAAMYAEMYERKIQCPQLQKTIHLAASLIEVRRISYNLISARDFLYKCRLGIISARSKRRKSLQCIIGISISPAYLYTTYD
jgi:hypothetical protein